MSRQQAVACLLAGLVFLLAALTWGLVLVTF